MLNVGTTILHTIGRQYVIHTVIKSKGSCVQREKLKVCYNLLEFTLKKIVNVLH